MKSTMVGTLCACLCLSLLNGCSSRPRPKHVYRPGGSEVLLATDRAFAELAARAGTTEAFYRFADSEALMLPAGAEPIRGREEIRKASAADPNGELRWTPKGADISAAQDLGYTWGTYEFRGSDPNAAGSVHYGKYVTIWKVQPDGTWKYVVDVGNSSPAPH